MDIIKNGILENKKAKCDKCESVFTYRVTELIENKNEETGEYLNHSLICPVCNNVCETFEYNWLPSLVAALNYMDLVEKSKELENEIKNEDNNTDYETEAKDNSNIDNTNIDNESENIKNE